ncbi:hypothetical protein SBA6_640009 [Candidatus Sulfopaludibacter sp. SbA6]|nr:hypothetical protein SBA6_640009 [Candidatus Sulfopaludibacter sp. SbA6]
MVHGYLSLFFGGFCEQKGPRELLNVWARQIALEGVVAPEAVKFVERLAGGRGGLWVGTGLQGECPPAGFRATGQLRLGLLKEAQGARGVASFEPYLGQREACSEKRGNIAQFLGGPRRLLAIPEPLALVSGSGLGQSQGPLQCGHQGRVLSGGGESAAG